MAKKVLVVDDDPDVMLFSVSVLEEEGYTPLKAVNGEEGMKTIKKEMPDLIILDILMPRESGIRLYRNLKTNKSLRHIPVIVLSGIAEKSFLRSQKALTKFGDEEVPEPEIEVVVAARFIPEAGLILDDDIDTVTVPADIVPENAARSPDEVTGRVALIPISPDEMILINQVIVPDVKGEHVGFLMDKDKVAVAFRAGDLMAQSGLVRVGDHVDLFMSWGVSPQEGGSRQATFDALQNLEIAALIRPGGEGDEGPRQAAGRLTGVEIIILIMDPQDALVLKHLLAVTILLLLGSL